MSDGQTPLLHSNGARGGSQLWQLFSGCRWLKETLLKPGRKGNIQPGDNGRANRPRHLPSVKEHPTIEWAVIRQIFRRHRDGDVNRLRALQPSGQVTNGHENMALTKESANKMIEIFKGDAIDAADDMDMTLIHHTLEKEGIDYAEVLFQHAITEGKEIKLRWNGGDVLKAALDKYSRESVQFVLEKMSQRAANPAETVQVLTENMETLLQRFPYVIAKLLKNGKFCFKYGTFRVPKSVFDKTDIRPIGFVCDHIPQELKWKGEDEEVKEFWKKHNQKVRNCFTQSTSEEHVMAVSKFVAIEDVVSPGGKSFIENLNASKKCPVDVFKCEAVKANVHWKWHNYLSDKFLFGNVMYLFSVAFFFVFATYYGEITCHNRAWNVADLTGDTEEWNLSVARTSLCLSYGFLVIPIICTPPSYNWLFFSGVETETYLLVHAFLWNRHTSFSVFVVSIQCLIILFKSLRYLRPFRWFGLFITMISYLFVDILPFLFIGAILMITFGVAMFVLLGRSYQYHDIADGEAAASNRGGGGHFLSQDTVDDMINQYKQNFGSVWRCFEYLLYATVGNFETAAFHLSSDSLLSGWITVYFSVFVLSAAIILLSLLVSVLSDTFDRVMTHEEAEFVKHRAQRIAAFEKSRLQWKRCWFRSRSAVSTEHSASPVKYYYSGGHMKPIGDKLAVFHFLVPQDEAVIPAEDKAPWHGRIHAVAKVTQELIEKEKEEAKAERDRLAKHMSKVEERIEKLEGTIQQKLDDASKKNAEMLEQILEQMKQTQNETNIKSSDLESEEASLQNAAA